MRAVVAVVVACSVAVGALEAGVLILVVSTVLSVVDGVSTVDVELPVVGVTSMSAGTATAIAGTAAVAILGLHASIAALTSRVTAGVLHRMRRQIINAYVGATWCRQAVEQEGSLQEASSTLSLQSSGLVIQFSQLALGLSGLTMLLLGALVVNPVATLVVVVFGSVVFLLLRPIAIATRRSGRVFRASNSSLNESMSQWSSLAMDLRVFGVETVEADRLVQRSKQTSLDRAKVGFLNRFGSDLFKDVAILGLVLCVGAINSIENADVASIGAVVLLIVRSLSYAQISNGSIQSINEQGPNLEELRQRLDSLRNAPEVSGSTPLAMVDDISVVNVDYHYDDRAGVRGLTFDIPKGAAIGVVGPSGGGKSTLVQLLLRLRTPQAGRILVGGVDYQDILADDWQRLVSFVPQEPKLFEGSILDNISFFRHGFERQDIAAAAESAHVAEDILAMPEGLDTLLGPRGSGLSGGQKQRVAIARALVGKPQLLVLDEPTSALDTRSEELIQTTIRELKGHVTLVIVAHRLSTLDCCDRVIAMKGGGIVRIGSLDQALAELSMTDTALAERDAEGPA